MEIVTYTLRDDGGNSDGFYADSARLADEVLLHTEQRAKPAAEEYRRYILRSGAEPARSVDEYAFELLTLGVLCRTYAESAEKLRPWQGLLLDRLVRLRNGSQLLKPAADRARAKLSGSWLMAGEPSRCVSGSHGTSKQAWPTLERFDRLLLWLEAGGEFRQEAARLRLWRGFLARIPVHTARGVLLTALDEAAWFEEAAESALGRYTANVDSFRQQSRSAGPGREDALLRDRRRVEYHLNLIGAELMNRAYRADYDRCAGKALLLPACLKARPDGECPASLRSGPFRCTGCTAGCRIAILTGLGKLYGFEVIVAPHESNAFSRQVTDRLVRDRIGIIGVACPLNLLAGGWRAKALGIPAQCVILDYCGCRNHWDAAGFPTDLNLNRLLQILGVNSPGQGAAEQGML